MNILKKVFIVSIFLALTFTFRSTEAVVEFVCASSATSTNPRVSESDVNITVQVTNGNPAEWEIGLMEKGKTYPSQTSNFNSTSYTSDSNKINATYDFSFLKKGIEYYTIIVSKDNKRTLEMQLPNCSFTIPLPVDGVCGDAKGKTFSSEPKKDLCKSGKSSSVKQNYNQWEWNCDGEHDGKNSQTCIAIAGGSTSTTTTTTDSLVDASSKGGGLVPDCPAEGCGFDHLMKLINNVIKFLLFTIATPLAALIFVYAGFMLLTSGGSSEKMTTAKKILTNLIIGYVIALAAWLVINTILTSEFLGYKGPTFLKDK